MTSHPMSARRKPSAVERTLALRIAINWEIAIYCVIIGLAIGLRFWDLGARALHHDESIHAQWSWDLLRGNYRHSPIFHGPLYYHVQGFVFLIAGASDYTARVSAAIFGSALCLLPLLLRRRLGAPGTIAAMAFIAFSPTIVYYSRFFREDIYMAFFTLLMVVSMWRYIEEGRDRWLVLLATGFLGSILAKEGGFITTAVFLVYLDVHLASVLARQTLTARGANVAWRRVFVTIFLTPFAFVVAALWPFCGGLRKYFDWDESLPRSGHLLVLLGTITLPLLTPVSRHYLLEPLGLIHIDPATNESRLSWEKHLQSNVTVRDGLALVGLFAITTSIAAFAGLQWRPRLWSAIFLVGGLVYLTLMTSLWTNMDGLISGPWGSLDYWVTQQEVARGDQPWFYYYMVMPAYEFLPLTIVAGGLFWVIKSGDGFERLCLVWLVGMWLALSFASEKMPWNNTHIALPACMLAAAIVQRAWLAWQPRPPARDLLALLTVAVTAAGAMVLIAFMPGETIFHAIRVLAVAVIAGAIWWVIRPYGRRALPTALVIATVGALSLFSARTMVMAVYERGDVPKDLLVYTQSSPDIARIASDIDRLAEVTGRGYTLRIAVDSSDSYAWPWAWYLRDYRGVAYIDFGSSVPQGEYDVYLVNASNVGRMNDHLAATGDTRFASPERYPHRWWFDERYKTAMAVPPQTYCSGLTGDCGPRRLATWERLFDGIRNEGWLKDWALFWRDHDADAIFPNQTERVCRSCGSTDAYAYFPAAFDRATGTLSSRPIEPPAPTTDADGNAVFGGTGTQPGQFFAPVDIEADAQGNLYVIDSATRRLQKFDAAGNFIASVDIRTVPGDGSEPSEPWGLGVAPKGDIIVADTFGWRVRAFTADLQPTGLTFGQPSTSPEPGPYELFGPRDIVVDAQGQIWVTDTGNDRIMVYSSAGEFAFQVGSSGSGEGQFDEPVGLALAPNGDVLISDMYNGRVVRLDGAGNFLSAFPVPGWGGQDVPDKPYLRVLRNGNVALGLPSGSEVRIYSPDGTLIHSITGGTEPVTRPYGLVEAADGKLWVVDGGSARVRQFSLP